MSEIVNGLPGVFLDRDGTLIRDVGYLRRPEQIEILPGVPEALLLLHEHGFKIVVVTNQSGIARGFFSEDELKEIHQALGKKLAAHNVVLDGIYYCPHHPTEGVEPYRTSCGCRKPKDGLTRQAVRELKLDLGRSYVVGDKPSDIELAVRIGAKGIQIKGTETVKEIEKVKLMRDLWEAARWIVGDNQSKR